MKACSSNKTCTNKKNITNTFHLIKEKKGIADTKINKSQEKK